jgi:uncharacterized membrane protein
MLGELRFIDGWIFISLWNYFLAIIPFVVSIIIQKYFNAPWKRLKGTQKGVFVAAMLFWIGMFPNIPYLFTEIRHLSDICIPMQEQLACHEHPVFILFLFVFGAFGLFLFYDSLSRITSVLQVVTDSKKALLFPLVYLPITALGILLGLIDRLNSWDIIFHLDAVFMAAFAYISTGKVVILAAYSLFLIGMYYGLHYWLHHSKRN